MLLVWRYSHYKSVSHVFWNIYKKNYGGKFKKFTIRNRLDMKFDEYDFYRNKINYDNKIQYLIVYDCLYYCALQLGCL